MAPRLHVQHVLTHVTMSFARLTAWGGGAWLLTSGYSCFGSTLKRRTASDRDFRPHAPGARQA